MFDSVFGLGRLRVSPTSSTSGVQPLNGGGAANFGSGAANLFPGSPQNLVVPPFRRFSCGFSTKI